MLIIWLQGIWLPQHGYDFARTPLWAGIYMVPLTVGFLVAGPISGILSDRYGARPFATGGMIGAAVAFALLELLPVDFGYVWFGLILLLMGLSMGVFGSPNRAAVMNSLPPDQRGAGAGMMTTFQNAATVLSIGVFFTVIILGLSSTLPSHLYNGLVANGVPAPAAHQVASLPPISSLFSALLGYNPIQQLLGPSGVLSHVSAAQAAHLTGRSFFPQLISSPFGTGLHYAFDFAIVASLIAAVASWLRGGKYVHGQDAPSLATAGAQAGSSTDGRGADAGKRPSSATAVVDGSVDRVLASVGAGAPATNGYRSAGQDAHDVARGSHSDDDPVVLHSDPPAGANGDRHRQGSPLGAASRVEADGHHWLPETGGTASLPGTVAPGAPLTSASVPGVSVAGTALDDGDAGRAEVEPEPVAVDGHAAATWSAVEPVVDLTGRQAPPTDAGGTVPRQVVHETPASSESDTSELSVTLSFRVSRHTH